jgi:magnesium-transporting ATPase (P-type)
VTDTTERNKKQDKVNTLDKENHANVTKYKWQIQQKGTISYSTQIIENCNLSCFLFLSVVSVTCIWLHWHDFLCPVYLLCPVSCSFLFIVTCCRCSSSFVLFALLSYFYIVFLLMVNAISPYTRLNYDKMWYWWYKKEKEIYRKFV